MEAETALRLQAARDHLTLAAEELTAINAGPDLSSATQTAATHLGLSAIALQAAVAGIPAGLLMPTAAPGEAVA